MTCRQTKKKQNLYASFSLCFFILPFLPVVFNIKIFLFRIFEIKGDVDYTTKIIYMSFYEFIFIIKYVKKYEFFRIRHFRFARTSNWYIIPICFSDLGRASPRCSKDMLLIP